MKTYRQGPIPALRGSQRRPLSGELMFTNLLVLCANPLRLVVETLETIDGAHILNGAFEERNSPLSPIKDRTPNKDTSKLIY